MYFFLILLFELLNFYMIMNHIPTEVLSIYSSLVALVYFATDCFNNNSPFAFSIPVIVLGFFTFSTRMSNQKRSLTAFSFFSMGNLNIL